ncbi:MAG: M48 family metallopeptidase [Gammaproteobacteria bacterium]|nr:M48 family metallopeptidase [Gammaproteobacteria bacterium]
MNLNEYSWLVLAVLAAGLCVQLWLAWRHIGHVRKHNNQVPDAFTSKISLEAHQKAANYTIAKTHLGVANTLLNAGVLLIWTFAGGLEILDQLWRTTGWDTLYTGTALLLTFMLIGILIDLPLSLYSTFVLEEEYGFNKMTLKIFFTDMVKGIALAGAIGTPLIMLILWLMEKSGSLWWFYVWAVWMGFSLLLMWAYPKFIAPLFNKFEPLEDEELKNRITALLNKCGFASNGIFVMDGSTRSGHGNAYFTGFGANKRIVFFDTLIKSLSVDETEAVLAHELGHFKRNHIKKTIALMAAMSLAGLAILGWLIDQPDFYTGLGIDTPSTYMGLLLFVLVIPLFTFFISPLFSAFSRKNEFEADDYAKQQSNAADLVSALVKMYEENASTLTPDPLHSAFYDSHPPAPVRIARLQGA